MSTESELDKLRAKIDSLDDELLQALARRMEVVKGVGAYKKAEGLELRDDERLRQLLKERLERAEALGLPKDLVRDIYELIHEYALRIEAES